MLKSLLSHLVFWPFMLCMIAGSTLVVVFGYFPFVALKALWLKATGRLDQVTGSPKSSSSSPPRPHIG